MATYDEHIARLRDRRAYEADYKSPDEEKVTTVTVYLPGAVEKVLNQPGFYHRLRELLADFGSGTALIAIEESEVY